MSAAKREEIAARLESAYLRGVAFERTFQPREELVARMTSGHGEAMREVAAILAELDARVAKLERPDLCECGMRAGHTGNCGPGKAGE